MRIIFLSLMFSEKQLQAAFQNSKIGVQMAPHTFQSRLCRGLNASDDVSLKIVSCAPVGSYPIHYKKSLIQSDNSENQIAVGFLNLPKVKYHIQQRRLYAIVKSLITDDEPTVLLIYTLQLPLLRVASHIKKCFPNTAVCLIQTDSVPGVDDMEKHMTSEAKKRGKVLLELSKCCDGFVILTDYLKTPLQIGNRPYVVVEGIASDQGVLPVKKDKKEDQSVFFYSGSLNTAYGIKELTEAFFRLDARLLICGDGDYKSQLISQINANEKKNIEYLGYLTPDEVAEIRSSADFLINPRRPSGTYTKYSFPSKTMEYLSSGVPTVMYHLEGIPSEYDNYLNYISGITPDQIAAELNQLILADRDTLWDKAEAAKNFVLKEKNEFVQAEKIRTLLLKISGKG